MMEKEEYMNLVEEQTREIIKTEAATKTNQDSLRLVVTVGDNR